MESLPVAGVDGTLAARFSDLPATALLRAKTGSLDHVNTLSGYLITAKGKHLVLSIMANNHTLTSKKASEVIDEIVELAEQSKE